MPYYSPCSRFLRRLQRALYPNFPWFEYDFPGAACMQIYGVMHSIEFWNPKSAKQLLMVAEREGMLDRPTPPLPFMGSLFRHSLIWSNGETWARQHKVRPTDISTRAQTLTRC